VTAGALAGKSEVSAIEVFNEYRTARPGRNEFRLVAVRASDPGMLPCECETRLAVIHRLAAWFPVNEPKIGAIVLRVAGRAIFAGSIRAYPDGMHAAPLRQAFAYLRVALQTFQLRSAAG
jgi:hypothetical protein